MLNLDFDLIIILVLIAFILIGYVTGATTEFIKLLKLVIPFLIVFYFGGPIARLVFKSSLFNSLINSVSFLREMSYFNTLVMFISTFIAFLGSYIIIGIIIKFIQKKIQSEVVTFKLGRFNNGLGAILAVVRFYILASLLLLPFYLLNITNKSDDFLTKVILDNPPVFTRIGHFVNSTEPVVNATNALTDFMDVVDLNKIRTYYDTLTELPNTLNSHNDELNKQVIEIRKDNLSFSVNGTGKYVTLVDFLNDSDRYIYATNNDSLRLTLLELKAKYLPYRGLLTWVIENNIETLDNNALIAAFHTDYDEILANTPSEGLRGSLQKAYKGTEIYLTINDWLVTEIGADTSNLMNLLDDDTIEKILEQLVTEFANKNTQGLIYDLNRLGNETLNHKLISVEKFVINYGVIYKPIMDKMVVNLPFKYKLIASTMTNVKFIDSLKRSPSMAMYVIDTLEFIHKSGLEITDEDLYHSLVKIIIPVYLIKPDENGNVEPYTKAKMEELLVGIDKGIEDVVLTEEFVITMLDALAKAKLNPSDPNSILYIEHLVNSREMTKEAVLALSQYALLTKSSDSRCEEIRNTLQEVGD